MSYLRLLMSMLGILPWLLSCQKGETPQTPIYPVSMQIRLQQSEYRALLSPVNIVLITNPQSVQDRLGFGGLALVHGWQLNSFYAFDLACPYENRANLRLINQEHELVCPECHTRYEVLGGTGAAIKGIGRSPLRRYRVSLNEVSKILTITN